MPLFQKGDKGYPVRMMQLSLIHVGIPLPQFGADGHFGRETETAIKVFQHWQTLPKTGKFDTLTRDTLFYVKTTGDTFTPEASTDPDPESVKTPADKSTEGNHAGAHWVRVNPQDLRISDDTDKPGYDFDEENYMTAAFLGHQSSDGATFPTSMLASDGHIIRNTQPNGLYEGPYKGKGIPGPTLVVYEDLTVASVVTNDLTTLPKKVRFAVAGMGAVPYDPSGYKGYETSVGYRTTRVGLGYHPSTNTVLLLYHPKADIHQFGTIMKELGCSNGISTDSGGSAVFRVRGKFIRSTVRRLPAVITW